MSICKLYTILIEEHNVLVRNIYHKLFVGHNTITNYTTDNSDVNPPKKLISDRGTLPRKASRESQTLKTVAFIYNSISAITDMICPYYYAFLSNVSM